MPQAQALFTCQKVDVCSNILRFFLKKSESLEGFWVAAKSLLWLIAHFNTNVQTFLFLSSQLLAARLQIGIRDDNKKNIYISYFGRMSKTRAAATSWQKPLFTEIHLHLPVVFAFGRLNPSL